MYTMLHFFQRKKKNIFIFPHLQPHFPPHHLLLLCFPKGLSSQCSPRSFRFPPRSILGPRSRFLRHPSLPPNPPHLPLPLFIFPCRRRHLSTRRTPSHISKCGPRSS